MKQESERQELTDEEFEEINDNELLENFPPFEVEELDKETILSDLVMDYLVALRDSSSKTRIVEKVRDKARELKAATAFNNIYKQKEREKGISIIQDNSYNTILFPGLENIPYKTTSYKITDDGKILQTIPKLGDMLISYQLIIPIERYINLEDRTEKIKIAFYDENKWENIIVDREMIATSQNIVKLASCGIEVTSENAKFLVKYLSEIINLNNDKIPKNISVSRLGWAKDVLIPYSNQYEFDNEMEFPRVKEKFSENGKLEDWIDFFRERRKENSISRIVMASAVSSILLSKIKQNGFTLHIFGESEFGKTVACMVGQSIFGNPAQNENGIGINFNFTAAGLEYRLNLYNNIPLFINEMQHQKDAKDYDKMLFLISEGKGKSRATKGGGIAKENSWNNVVITNGEKNIIKDNSNAGAYNRCISCEITSYSFKELSVVADFVKENYGTPIREILKHIDDFDYKKIYKDMLDSLEIEDITNKQKILAAIVLMGDKIVTDILFKDNYYLTAKDFSGILINKKEVAIEERAYETIRDWYVSEKRHFLSENSSDVDNQELKVEIYGKEMQHGYLAIIPSVLAKVLEEDGYDYKEVINAWKRKNYLKHEREKNLLTVRINNARTKCIVLDMKKSIYDSEEETEEEQEENFLPF